MLADLTVLLNSMGLGQALVLASLLWWRGGKLRASNRFLAIVLLSFAVAIVNTIIGLSPYKWQLPYYQLFANAVVLLISPSLYLYVCSRRSAHRFTSPQWVVHYLIFALQSTLLLLLVCLGPSYSKRIDQLEQLGLIIFHLQFAIYLFFTFQELKRTSQAATASSSSATLALQSIRQLFWAITATWLISLSFYLFEHYIHWLPDALTLNVSLILVLIVGQLAYRSYKTPQLFTQSLPLSLSHSSNATNLDWDVRLEQAMKEQQLYLQPELSLHQLAQHCHLPARQLSQYLNQHKNTTFFDYINSYRVAHLKGLLGTSAGHQYTIQALARQSGFRSISTAYSAFKRSEGKTPAQFKKEQKSKG